MKKTLVIVVHPDLTKSVINKAWAKAIEGAATIHHLYEQYPNGQIDLAHEQALLEAHDRIVFQFPLYWYAAPYLLKKWMDEVFTEGWAYGAGGDKMEGKEICAAVSCGSPKSAFAEGAQQCHTLRSYLNVFDGIAAFLRARFTMPATIPTILACRKCCRPTAKPISALSKENEYRGNSHHSGSICFQPIPGQATGRYAWQVYDPTGT